MLSKQSEILNTSQKADSESRIWPGQPNTRSESGLTTYSSLKPNERNADLLGLRMLVPNGVLIFVLLRSVPTTGQQDENKDNLLREPNSLIIIHKRTLLMKQVHLISIGTGSIDINTQRGQKPNWYAHIHNQVSLWEKQRESFPFEDDRSTDGNLFLGCQALPYFVPLLDVFTVWLHLKGMRNAHFADYNREKGSPWI